MERVELPRQMQGWKCEGQKQYPGRGVRYYECRSKAKWGVNGKWLCGECASAIEIKEMIERENAAWALPPDQDEQAKQ